MASHTPEVKGGKEENGTHHRKRTNANVRSEESGRQENADNDLSEKFGYNQVFERKFGYLSSFSFAFSVSGLFATVATTFSYPLYGGGSASAVWSWLISGFGCMCIASSVAELVSAYPTSGGLYYTVSHVAPKPWVPSISWITGWLNVLGQIAGVASSEWGSAELLLAAVSIGTDFKYIPKEKHFVGVMAGLTIITGAVNSLSTEWLAKITKTYVIFHVLVIVTCCIALLAMAQPSNGTPKHDAKYVFTDIQDLSGWRPVGWSFCFGFLSVSWTMTDYDATAHIAEEIKKPEITAARAIFHAMAFTYIVGFLLNIVLCFTMGDPAVILDSKMGQPVVQIFYNVLGKAGGITFAICGFIVLKFVCFTAMQALGRTVFAFSRDRLLPFSNIWVKINQKTGTPLLAVWISVALSIAINLIGLGSYYAIDGVFTLTSIALDWSYCIPAFCKLVFRRFEPGPWYLGTIGYIANAWACIWTVFVSVIYVCPYLMPVKASEMNYSSVYLVAILIFAYGYWFIRGKKFYTGPITQTKSYENESGENDSGHQREDEESDEKKE